MLHRFDPRRSDGQALPLMIVAMLFTAAALTVLAVIPANISQARAAAQACADAGATGAASSGDANEAVRLIRANGCEPGQVAYDPGTQTFAVTVTHEADIIWFGHRSLSAYAAATTIDNGDGTTGSELIQ
jgi:hypothetical protein